MSRRRGVAVTVAAAAAVLCIACGDKTPKTGSQAPKITEKVTVDVHLMSKCPFGVRTIAALLPVVQKMGDAVALRLHYIGQEVDGKLKSMHGDDEVRGDVVQLCVAEKSDRSVLLSFLRCQLAAWRDIPKNWERCARKAGADVAAVRTCVSGDEGRRLAKESFAYSASKRITASPTIFINGTQYMGSRTEAAFGRALCGAFTRAKPRYCADLPAPPTIPVTVIGDKRCTYRTCSTRRFVAFVRNTFEGAAITELDWSDPKAQQLFVKTKEKYLPVAVFDAAVEKDEAGFSRLRRRLKKMDTGQWVYPLGDFGKPPWDPRAEVCDDGVDNTGDGKVDCDDPMCADSRVCREEIPRRLDLWVMSQCPYGMRAEDAVAAVLDHFERDETRIAFRLHFIGTVNDEEFSSMHGESEVREDMRQLCAQKHYRSGYAFMDYVRCRNEMFRGGQGGQAENAWEACAVDGISAEVLRRCAEGEEGRRLLEESFRTAEKLGVTASPSWLLNNRYDLRSRTAAQIKEAFCSRNPDVPGCERDLQVAQASSPVTGACGAQDTGAPVQARTEGKEAADSDAQPDAP